MKLTPCGLDVMKFHHLGQLLLDTNCLLLILKMFGLQEVATTVVSRADSPENKLAPIQYPQALWSIADTIGSFFRYCQIHFSKTAGPAFHDNSPQNTQRKTVIRTTILPNGQKHEEEIELLTDFSWRNFFATINFAKVMQKLSKHRSHRIWMLVQYKSSVCFSSPVCGKCVLTIRNC